MSRQEAQPAFPGGNDFPHNQHSNPGNKPGNPYFAVRPSANNGPSSGGPSWGSKATSTEGARKKHKKKDEGVLDWRNFHENNKKKAAKTDASRGTLSEDTASELSTDETAIVPSRVKRNGSVSSDHSQSTSSNCSQSTEYGQPPAPILLRSEAYPSFGTKSNPVKDDVRMRLEMGLPVQFISGRPIRRRTDKESRAKSSSSERGVLGCSDNIVPMRSARPADWSIVRSGEKEDEATESRTASGVIVEDGGCCETESKDAGMKSGDKTLPEHEEMYIDSHCHLDFMWEKQSFAGMDILRKRFKKAFPSTFKGCIANFIKPDNWSYVEWIKTVAKDDQVLGTSWGIHPHHSDTATEEHKETLRDILTNHRDTLKIVAVGECGIDLSGRNDVPLDKQLEIFQFQVDLAYKLDLPIIIHCREGKGPDKDPEDAVLNVLKAHPNHPIHRHCFTRDVRVAEKWMKTLHNCTFGFTPVITTKEYFVPVIKYIPIDRIHLETDAPYFKTYVYSAFSQPATYSLPGAAITVAIRIAEITGLPLEEVIRATRHCTQRIYRLTTQ